jgi:hypothetical protein
LMSQLPVQPATVQPLRPPSSAPIPSKLPLGWEARVDPRTGQTFYIDHINKATSWSPPLM